MFGKVFASLWQGSMVGQADAQLVFVYMIANCDVDGFIDQTQEVIAALTGIPVERVRVAVEMLSAPDPRSRSVEEGGRRIVPMDDARDWGWQIVNYWKYRAMRDEEVRRAQNRASSARRRERVMTRQHESAPVSRGQPSSAHAEGEADGEGEEESKDVCGSRSVVATNARTLDLLRSTETGDRLDGDGVSSGGAIVAGRGGGADEASEYRVVSIPLAGGGEFCATVVDLMGWRECFPGVALPAEFRRMRAWCLANPKKRKTARGVRAFVARWLDEEQNRRAKGDGRRGDPKAEGARRYREANR